MRSYAKLVDDIRSAGGDIVAISSEPQSLAAMASPEWDLGYETVGDPHHEILHTCRSRKWMDVYINKDNGEIEASRSWVSNPNGMFQPGVLVMSKEGRVLYRWRSRPSRENIGGATVRPTNDYVWEEVKKRLNAPDQHADAEFDESPVYDMKPVPWPLFMTLLLAHGWFLGPKVFPAGKSGEKERDPFKMWPRVALFALFIVAAFVLFPAIWVVLGLAAWGLYVWPKISKYNREFQIIPDDEVLSWDKP